MRHQRRFAFFALTLCCLTALGFFIYRTSVFRPMLNFHEVDPGQFFRSAQMTPDELRDAVHKYGIRTVINLRGDHPEDAWYNDEQATLRELGVRMVDVAFSTQSVPAQSELRKYVQTLENSQRPILVHCRAGADRTGEASAIYAMEYMYQSRAKALEQLSFKYLHISYFQPAKRFMAENYLGRDWAVKEYSPCSAKFLPYASRHDCPHPDSYSTGETKILTAGWGGSFWNRLRESAR